MTRNTPRISAKLTHADPGTIGTWRAVWLAYAFIHCSKLAIAIRVANIFGSITSSAATYSAGNNPWVSAEAYITNAVVVVAECAVG